MKITALATISAVTGASAQLSKKPLRGGAKDLAEDEPARVLQGSMSMIQGDAQHYWDPKWPAPTTTAEATEAADWSDWKGSKSGKSTSLAARMVGGLPRPLCRTRLQNRGPTGRAAGNLASQMKTARVASPASPVARMVGGPPLRPCRTLLRPKRNGPTGRAAANLARAPHPSLASGVERTGGVALGASR